MIFVCRSSLFVFSKKKKIKMRRNKCLFSYPVAFHQLQQNYIMGITLLTHIHTNTDVLPTLHAYACRYKTEANIVNLDVPTYFYCG